MTIRFPSARKFVTVVAAAAALGLAAFAGVTSMAGTGQAASPGLFEGLPAVEHRAGLLTGRF